MRKVDLVGAYMSVWLKLIYVPTVDLLVPRENENDPQLVGFHLSILMGYVESTPLLWPGIGVVCHRHIHIPFTRNKYSVIFIGGGCNPYMSHRRCSGGATTHQERKQIEII